MKNLFKTSIFVFALTSLSAFAAIEGEKSNKIKVKVHGMVCSFCATGVKKGFSKLDMVQDVDVNLDDMEVNVVLKEGTSITEEILKSTVSNSGYEYVGALYE